MTNTISSLVNQTPLHISINADDSELTFYLANGTSVNFYHSQDCCESVTIEDIVGDFDSLLFKPILQADEKVNSGHATDDYQDESWTETFYTFANINSVVDVRWYGSSNGYYSESVDIEVVPYDMSLLPNLTTIKANHPELLI